MRQHYFKLSLILLLVTLGLVMEIAGLLDAAQLLQLARQYAGHWWLILILILAQTLLFSFALAGSLFLWVVAPIYQPASAALILAVGGGCGGLGAYFFSRFLTVEWRQRIENSRSYRLLQAQDNFFALFAMRVFPGFPHSLVNYSAGILKARLSHFVVATLLGVGLKSYLYARVIYPAAGDLSLRVLLDFKIIAPLILLAGLSIAVLLLQGRSSRP